MKKRTTTSPTPQRAPAMAIAACTMALSVSGNELQLTPSGAFRARDGRPVEVSHWYIDAAIAAALVAAADQRGTPFVIDYDHQTLLAKTNGQPSPAAGWFKKLEWREGTGLFAVDVEWTPRAKDMIAAGEYKFISPVFTYDEKTGAVTAMLMAAITNNPAIDGMEQVLVAAACLQFDTSSQSIPQENSMEELLEQLRWLLNLPVGATADDTTAQLQKLIDTIKKDTTVVAAASFDLATYLANQRTAMAALSAAKPDPAKYVPIEVVAGLQGQIAALNTTGVNKQIDDVVSGALKAGKLLPVQETWARELGAQNLAALTAFIDQAPPLAILSGTQTNGVAPQAGKIAALTDNQLQLCKALGVTPEDFLKTLQAEPLA